MRLFGMISTQSSRSYTDHALETFVQNTELRPFDRFILVDNDGSYGELPEQLRSIGSIERPRTPRSFAQNVNEVMATAFKERADLFFLNNDLIFPKGWLSPLLVPEVSLLSPLSNREIQHTLNNFKWGNVLSLEDYIERRADFETIAAQHIHTLRGTRQVLALPFFCIKIPFLVFEQVGPLDEGYGLGGGEDYDYCLKAQEKGIPAKYIMQSYVLHFSGKSTWAGAEDESKTSARRAEYTAAFTKRWGQTLTDLLIEEKQDILSKFPEVHEHIQSGNLKQVLSILKAA